MFLAQPIKQSTRCGGGAGVERTVIVASLLMALGSLNSAWAIDKPIPYDVVKPSGYSEGIDNGSTAYQRKRRGEYDREPMVQIEYFNRPSDLPPPTVVAPSPLPIVQEFQAGKVFSKSDLRGEDAVFQRIYDDEEADRCLLNRQACEDEAQAQQQRRQFIPAGELPPEPR